MGLSEVPASPGSPELPLKKSYISWLRQDRVPLRHLKPPPGHTKPRQPPALLADAAGAPGVTPARAAMHIRLEEPEHTPYPNGDRRVR